MKQVTICIPNLNQDEALLSTLLHLKNQNIYSRGFRVIVSNNGESGLLGELKQAYSSVGAEVLHWVGISDATEHFFKIATVVKSKWLIFVGCGDAVSLDALESFLILESSNSASKVSGGKIRVSAFSQSSPMVMGEKVRGIERNFFSLRVPYQEALVGNILSSRNFLLSCEKTGGRSRQDWPHIITQLRGASARSTWIEILDPLAFVFQHEEGWYNKKYEGTKKVYSHLLSIAKNLPRPSVFIRLCELLIIALPKSIIREL